jgi:hypothetical protein
MSNIHGNHIISDGIKIALRDERIAIRQYDSIDGDSTITIWEVSEALKMAELLIQWANEKLKQP